MKVREFFEAKIPGYPLKMLGSVIKGAAFSPALAEPRLLALDLDEDLADHLDDELWIKSLKYALSTLYYSMSGVFSGGSRTEQDGDVRASLSGFVITQSDRAHYRRLGDELREEIGYPIEKTSQDEGGMFDATSLRQKRR